MIFNLKTSPFRRMYQLVFAVKQAGDKSWVDIYKRADEQCYNFKKKDKNKP